MVGPALFAHPDWQGDPVSRDARRRVPAIRRNSTRRSGSARNVSKYQWTGSGWSSPDGTRV